MRRGLLLGLLLRAAADDRVVPRRLDTAVPPWLVRGADLEAVPLDVTRALPLEPGGGSAHRGLQSSSDACDYVSVSGSTGWSSYHGLYNSTGTCDSKPSYECLDCSGSGRKIWHHPYGYWFMGTDGCDSTASGINIISNDDLEDVSGDWREWDGSAWSANSAIAVTCYSYCKEIPGSTDKYRCFDCADASAPASVGDGQCDAANNVDPCYDGGDCCETTCVDGSSTCGSYDCKDPDAPPVPDPYYPDAAWYLEAIRAPEAWAAGYTGDGVQILINDDGVDNTHPDLAKLDVANSCAVYAPCTGSDGTYDTHGTNCAAIAAGDSNSACGVGAAPDAGIASCVQSFSNCPSPSSEDTLTHNYNVNDISSNSWIIYRCAEYSTSATDCPFACPSVSSADCPCDACDGDDWASGNLSSTCKDAVVDYCTTYFDDDVTPCLELDHYFVECGYSQISTSGHNSLVDGTTNGRGGLGTVYVFAAGNEYDRGEDVNYAGYQNSRFTITVGAVYADLTHSDYSQSGAPVFIAAPGGDGGDMAVAKPVGNGVTDDCADAGQGTSFAAPLVSGVAAMVLEANPNLTWRDVQGVLAATARTDFNDEDDETGQWTTNQAGVKHSYKYGFGLVDALAATAAATTWTTLGAEITLVTATTSGAALLDFDGTEHWVESEAAEFGSSDFVIEGVSVYVTIEHPRRGDLRIELERNGVTSLLTDDKLELGTDYTNWKFTTLRHWGETADSGAFTLRVADQRAGSGDDDDLGSRRRLDDDDGVLVSWTLQLYGHDSDTSTPWTPQPTPRGGCDSVAVSGSTSQSSRHGTYLPDGRCEDNEDNVYYKCSDCSSTNYLWYHDSYGRWYMGPDAVGEDGVVCSSSLSGIYIISDEDLEDVSGDWSEYTSSGWSANSNIVVQCSSSPSPSTMPTGQPTALPTATPMPTGQPTALPTATPTAIPSSAPTAVPLSGPTSPPSATQETYEPTVEETAAPSYVPSSAPTYPPTVEETAAPSYETWVPTTAPPSYVPSSAPTAAPAAPTTPLPSYVPSSAPTAAPAAPTTPPPPSYVPSSAPTAAPWDSPTPPPSYKPTPSPTVTPGNPTAAPVFAPTPRPSSPPSSAPTAAPTVTAAPTLVFSPTFQETYKPTVEETAAPSYETWVPTTAPPSYVPSSAPTAAPAAPTTPLPSYVPSSAPTAAPAAPTTPLPTFQETYKPTYVPSSAPTAAPAAPTTPLPSTRPTPAPSYRPTPSPSPSPSTGQPTILPTASPGPSPGPTAVPTAEPTFEPTAAPSAAPSAAPTVTPTLAPTPVPSPVPTQAPTPSPTNAPSTGPSPAPTLAPTVEPTLEPTASPTAAPSAAPTVTPTLAPTPAPSVVPSLAPSPSPTVAPSPGPSPGPTAAPTPGPSPEPTIAPSAAPSAAPTVTPTLAPTPAPSAVPSLAPTLSPTTEPTQEPTAAPTAEPTGIPTTPSPSAVPSMAPTPLPSAAPSSGPTRAPTALPTLRPTASPTSQPTLTPTATPTSMPTTPAPSAVPTLEPTSEPTIEPTAEPSVEPTSEPTAGPTPEPTAGPTQEPTAEPTLEPTAVPTAEPTSEPTAKPTREPTALPTTEPTSLPTSWPTHRPTPRPSQRPTPWPSPAPAPAPTFLPTPRPSPGPSPKPTRSPTLKPTPEPTVTPGNPTAAPVFSPTPRPSFPPTSMPTKIPTSAPSPRPTPLPTPRPTPSPSPEPSHKPTPSPTTAMPTTALPSPAPTSVPTISPPPSPVPSLAPTTINYRLADFSVAAPPELAEAAFTGTGLKVEHLVVNLTVPATKPVRVTLRGGGRSGGNLRFYDEDSDNPGYALTSDAGSASVSKWIPAGDTNCTVAAGALRDRVDNGDSVAQSVTVLLSSTDPIYGRARGFEKTVSVHVLDVDESLIAVNKFLATTDPVTSGAITAKAKENAATFVFTAALTSLPFSAVRLEVEGDVDAFESISVDGADGMNRTVEPADWASLATYEFRVADDAVLSGDRNYSVWFVARSADANYDGVRSPNMTCQVIEDDVAFATVSGKALTVGAGINGPTFGDGYWITLSAPPKADVVVSLGCADTSVFYTKQLLFTPDDWDRKYVAVNASLADPNILEGRTAMLTHSVASADAFFDGLAVSDVEIAVEFSVDSVPPPKLELVRFLDGGNGLDVLFDSATNMVDGEWDIDCATLFEYAAQQFGADGTCSWTNSSALRVTFGAGAQIVPFDYVAATDLNSAYLKGDLLKNDLDGATLTSAAQYAEAQKPLHPVAPAISITAPESVGVCDGVVLDARGATGGGSRALTYNWGVLTTWDAETDADMASLAALETKLAAADAAGAVTLSLGFDDLLAGRAYDFLIAATNFLGVTTTAYATVGKLGSPSPRVQFQGAATQTMVRSDRKTLKLDVALPNLTCTDMNVSSAALGFAWRAWRLEGAEWGDASPELSRAAMEEYAANPVSCRLPVDALRAGATYMFRATVGFADTMTINSSATATVVVRSQDLIASISGGVEQTVAIGTAVELDGSESYDPDDNDAEGAMAYAWTVARVLDDGGREDLSTALLDNATQPVLAFTPTTAAGWASDTSYEFTLTVSRGTRSAAYSVLVSVSSDQYMPRATITGFDESVKYNPTEGAFTAIYFKATSPDPDRTIEQTAWSVGDGQSAGLLGKPSGAPSPMLVDLGKTRPNAVYRLKLTVTDSIGSTSSTVVSLTTNGPPTSGTFAVSPYRGTALTTEFEFLLDGWSDDVDDYPLTYTYSYRQRVSRGGAGRFTSFADRRAAISALTPLVADQYASSWFVTTLPQADNVNLTCVGRVFDRYLSYAQAFTPVRVDALEISTEDLSAFAGDLLSASADTGDGEASLSLVSNVASVIGGTDASRRRLSSEQELIDDLMGHTISAASLVGTDSSAAAATQVLFTVSTLTGDPDSLSESAQTGAIGLLREVVGDAATHGIDDDTAASAADAVSSLLDASLFASGASNSSLDGQMTGTVGALATGMIVGAYGGQNKSVVTDNLELRAFRTDCGTRDAAFRLSSGAGVTDLPAAALDAAAGGGSCDADATEAPADVDVKVAQLKNVRASEGDGTVSDLVQIELGGEGATVKVDSLAEPIVFDIPFDDDPTLAAGYDPGNRTGTCYNRSQVLSFDCDVPTTFDCGESHEVTLPDGSTTTVTGANLPLEITVSCPARTAACSFWDNATTSWSSDGCAAVASTASGVTCACTHLTEFTASTNETDAAFSADAQPSPAPTPEPTTGQPSLAPTSQPSPGPTTTAQPTTNKGTCECLAAAPTKTITPAAKSAIYGCPRICSLSD